MSSREGILVYYPHKVSIYSTTVRLTHSDVTIYDHLTIPNSFVSQFFDSLSGGGGSDNRHTNHPSDNGSSLKCQKHVKAVLRWYCSGAGVAMKYIQVGVSHMQTHTVEMLRRCAIVVLQ
jgi:hypothetical protein